MTTIVFSNTFGPTVRDKMPSATAFAEWTYMYHDNVWYWVKAGKLSKNRIGHISFRKEWVLVPNESQVPKEHQLHVLLLS